MERVFASPIQQKKVGSVNIAIFHPLEMELSKEIEQAIFEKAAQIFI